MLTAALFYDEAVADFFDGSIMETPRLERQVEAVYAPDHHVLGHLHGHEDFPAAA